MQSGTGISAVAWLGCALAAAASALASLFIKWSAQAGPAWTIARVGWLGAAACTYVLGFVFYTIALQRLPMSVAYPVMVGLTMVLVAIIGQLVLQESLTASKLLGIALVSAGVYALTRSAA